MSITTTSVGTLSMRRRTYHNLMETREFNKKRPVRSLSKTEGRDTRKGGQCRFKRDVRSNYGDLR